MNSNLHLAIWILHGLIAFTFIASIPWTKLFHIITIPLNIFFQPLDPVEKLSPVSESGSVGAAKWQDFSWKQLLDFDACVKCGRCQDSCPAYSSGKILSPRDIMVKLKLQMHHNSNGKLPDYLSISQEELWSCTTCMACVAVCPSYTNQVSAIVDMRRHLVLEGQLDAELQDALANLSRYGNSFGKSPRMRARWARKVKPQIKDATKENVEYLWFVGDYASYHPALKDITLCTADVFANADLDFGILRQAENNSGNDIRRVGEEGLFELLVEKNEEILEKSNYKTIVTTDPHSYNTLKNEYPFSNGKPDVQHYSQLLDRLILDGQLELNKQLDYKVTYHDPCYLGRYNGIYDEPRRVIEATGCRLFEMPRTGDQSYCCGAGGGRIWMEEGDISERPSESRIREAAELDGVTIFVVACPKDIAMYTDAVKTTGLDEQIKVMDLIELVHAAI